MSKVYVNYPRGRVSFHGAVDCTHMGRQNKVNQRVVSVTPVSVRNLESEIDTGTLKFGSIPECNDLWLVLSGFKNSWQEKEVVAEIIEVLAKRYKVFRKSTIEEVC